MGVNKGIVVWLHCREAMLSPSSVSAGTDVCELFSAAYKRKPSPFGTRGDFHEPFWVPFSVGELVKTFIAIPPWVMERPLADVRAIAAAFAISNRFGGY